MILSYLVLSWAYINIQPFLAESKNNDIAIFYNIYSPIFSPWADHAMDIVKEQLEYMKNSIISNAPLYYVIIGKDIDKL